MTEKQDVWQCPFCYRECEFGTVACGNPDECSEVKNYVYMMTRQFPNGRITPKKIKEKDKS